MASTVLSGFQALLLLDGNRRQGESRSGLSVWLPGGPSEAKNPNYFWIQLGAEAEANLRMTVAQETNHLMRVDALCAFSEFG